MRILVTSTLYPPIALGGYERECAIVVGRLRQEHDVLVLTSNWDVADVPAGETGVLRTLPTLSQDEKGALRAPRESVAAVKAARRALDDFQPDLIYSWNGTAIPQAALRVLADSGTPMAFRVCEHWFGRLFVVDQFLRELAPEQRSPARAAWSALCRGYNAVHPALRLDPARPFKTAISWNSEAIRRLAGTPPSARPVLERIGHSVPRDGARYEAVVRDPAPEPEIAFVGRVTPYKGLAIAIEALQHLRDDHGLTVKLVVVGPEDEDHGAEMRALAEQLGVADQVEWMGSVDPDGVAAVLTRTHALILPSTWEEPFPLVTIEGAFARVPLVAADVGGVGEGMHDEEHALLYPATDAVAAARALARTLTETEQTAARVQRAFARAQEYRLEPYLEAQAAFVADAHEALQAASGAQAARVSGR
ncbi:glycosyltransferase [Baekduia sp. Peel2402]|uniref:glycosyltransferase n=1 Tax=Baekduia sp. Peel2402 TaxID=3458296 RepID=UPI00403E6C95